MEIMQLINNYVVRKAKPQLPSQPPNYTNFQWHPPNPLAPQQYPANNSIQQHNMMAPVPPQQYSMNPQVQNQLSTNNFAPQQMSTNNPTMLNL